MVMGALAQWPQIPGGSPHITFPCASHFQTLLCSRSTIHTGHFPSHLDMFEPLTSVISVDGHAPLLPSIPAPSLLSECT
jgi:hypothetical protein